jgi:hypothetical protein
MQMPPKHQFACMLLPLQGTNYSSGMYGGSGLYGSSGMYGSGTGMYGNGGMYGGGLYGRSTYGTGSMYGSGYGGYGSSGMYGSSMYGSGYGSGMYGGGYGGSMYGGGMYGGAMYGGQGGMYGGGPGMLGGPGGPMDPNQGPPAPPTAWQAMLAGINGIMHFFGRLSFLVGITCPFTPLPLQLGGMNMLHTSVILVTVDSWRCCFLFLPWLEAWVKVHLAPIAVCHLSARENTYYFV